MINGYGGCPGFLLRWLQGRCCFPGNDWVEMRAMLRQLQTWFGVFLLLPALSASAGRPLTVDDAAPVPPGLFELEAGIGYVGDGPLRHWDFPFALAYGVAPRLELGAGTGGQLEERGELASGDNLVTSVGDAILGTKWQPLDKDRFWADHALAFSVKLPTASRSRGLGSGETDFDLTWIATKPLGEKMSVHFNVGYTWLGDPAGENFDDVLHYGAALDRHLTKRLQLVAEIYANTPVHTASDTTLFLNGGVRWKAGDALVFDAAVGAGVRGAAPDVIATAGLTWVFGKGRK